MEDFIYYNELYDCYSKLLTDKQKTYFEDYYFENLSLSEIALKYNISRNAVYKQIQITISKLNEYEEKLNLNKQKKIIEAIIKKEKDKNIIKELEKFI